MLIMAGVPSPLSNPHRAQVTRYPRGSHRVIRRRWKRRRRLDSACPVCCFGKCWFWPYSCVGPPCLPRVYLISDLRDSTSLPVDPTQDWQYPERPYPGCGRPDIAYGSRFCILHWDHWSASHLRWIHDRTHLSPSRGVCYQNYGEGGRSCQCSVLAALFRSFGAGYQLGASRQRDHLGVCHRGCVRCIFG